MEDCNNPKYAFSRNLPSWVKDHELVGKPAIRSVACPLTIRELDGDQQRNKVAAEFYHNVEDCFPIACIQAEDSNARKPGLCRSLIPISLICDDSDLFRASDILLEPGKDKNNGDDNPIISDPTINLPSQRCISNIQERLNTVIYETVVTNWIPKLVMLAALEECQSQFLQQYIATQVHSGPDSPSERQSIYSSRVPTYYRQLPSSYLSAPLANGDEIQDQSNSILPVQFTPSQLVQRIKQGCSLVWQEYEKMIPWQIQVKSTATWIERRSSSRIARQQQEVQQFTDDRPKNEWKVLPGGKIATHLKHWLIVQLEEKAQLTATKNIAANKAFAIASDFPLTPDEENDNNSTTDLSTTDENPYLHESHGAVLEWLGRKTAKLLTTSDIQDTFPAFLYPVTKKKKKKMDSDADEITNVGVDVMEYLSPTNFRMWNKMLASGPNLLEHGARFFLKIINDEDTTRISDWEPASFGRSQFTVRIWNEEAERKLMQQRIDSFAAAEIEYREKKAWATWRHKGVNGGCTVWPSWLKAAGSWNQERGDTNGETNIERNEIKADEEGAPLTDDLALAKSLAEEDAAVQVASGGRRSRRTTVEGSSSGVFYGTQSNLTQKQLMEAMLRIISLNAFQTSANLAASVLDGSTDPHRRIRTVLGKLLWKRNQICRTMAQTRSSDAPAWLSLDQSALITVNLEGMKASSTSIDDTESDALVSYIRNLHKTELKLRSIIMKHLTEIPVSIIATSADEKPGLESSDCSDFESDGNNVEWNTSGHELLNKLMFRPSDAVTPNANATCQWMKVVRFCEPLPATDEDLEGTTDRPQIGRAKESTIVKRRCRFRVCLSSDPTTNHNSKNATIIPQLILTEAQVRAGIFAAEIEIKRTSAIRDFPENPFVGVETTPITLMPPKGSSAPDIVGRVVGHNCVYDTVHGFKQRILLLPENESLGNEALWVGLSFLSNGITECKFDDDSTVYTLQRSEFQPSSAPFQECLSIIELLRRNPKSDPFLEPVDPIALNVPEYFDVVKNPMDISMLAKNLENGKYSNSPSRKTVEKSPMARMINGNFRRDVELIFDNAMLFNPPDDWIHQTAASLKKTICKKMDQIVSIAESGFDRSRGRNSVYVDEDSDADIYEYESDADDEFVSAGRNRKRKSSSSRASNSEDFSALSIERPTRLQKLLSESMGVRGLLTNLPLNSNVPTFSLPSGWGCRRSKISESADEVCLSEQDTELDELIALQKSVDRREAITSRRSTRTGNEDSQQTNGKHDDYGVCVEFYPKNQYEMREDPSVTLPQTRSQLETLNENQHESRFAQTYQKLQKSLDFSSSESYGMFAENSFPPYLGRVVPEIFNDDMTEELECICKWEIREVYLIPALRWIIRGLVRSEHLSELETVDSSTESGVIVPNHIYFVDPKLEPFDVVDVREFSRKKKRENGGVADVSNDDVELSFYEQQRAERVARNAERLKALGLS